MEAMNRDQMLDKLRGASQPWDVVIIGGGATGLGCAVDAVSRGYRTALLDRSDFASGTSSRSTKLIHGGVRYLRQGNVRLVVEALREQRIIERNAPRLVTPLDFVIPLYKWWERPYYLAGLRLYDVLARHTDGARGLTDKETTTLLPTLRRAGLRGGIVYRDYQFDDAALALALANTAVQQGAAVINYCAVTQLRRKGDRISGVVVEDGESGDVFEVSARTVINATGVHADTIRRMDDADASALIAPSRGSHIVLDAAFLPGERALLVPHTDDGRVIFAIPWQGRVLVGTTDIPASDTESTPRATSDEINFLLSHVSRYLDKSPQRSDILSAFAGLRPLVARGGGRTAALSRDHHISISRSGLVTIAGGKWTTYRKMAEDCVTRAASVGDLPARPCRTAEIPIADDMSFGTTINTGVQHAVRHLMARRIEDVLGRRSRTLFLDARAAIDQAPDVARIIAKELGRSESWEQNEIKSFVALARDYLPGEE